MKRHASLVTLLLALIVPTVSHAASARVKTTTVKTAQLKTVHLATHLQGTAAPLSPLDWAAARGFTPAQVSSILAHGVAPDHTVEYIHWGDGTTETVDLGSQEVPTGGTARYAFGEQVRNTRGQAEHWMHAQSISHGTRHLSTAARASDGEIDEWCVANEDLSTSVVNDTYGLIEATAEVFCNNTSDITLDGTLFIDSDAVDASDGEGSTYAYLWDQPLVAGCYLGTPVGALLLADITIWWDGGGPDERLDGLGGYGCGYGWS